MDNKNKMYTIYRAKSSQFQGIREGLQKIFGFGSLLILQKDKIGIGKSQDECSPSSEDSLTTLLSESRIKRMK